MRRLLRNSTALLLALLMMFESGEAGIAYAVEKLNPTADIELTVPDKYQGAGNVFFIAKPDWTVSEKSDETLYIPIQRTGDLSAEADVILKVVDVTAKHDVNYTVEMYKDKTEPEIVLEDKSIAELVRDADGQVEFEVGGEVRWRRPSTRLAARNSWTARAT